MRKLFTCLTAIVLAVMMVMLSGCNLVTTDNEKDLNQVIVTVQISEDAPQDKIYKKDMAMAYLNYGYYYEQQGTYTREQVIDIIVNNLTNTRVYVQNAIMVFDAEDTSEESIFAGQIVDHDITDKWDVKRYLTEEELVDAEYNSKLAMSNLIDSYVEEDEEELGDAVAEEVRTVPTNAENAEEEELDLQGKKDYKIDTNSTSKRRDAYNKAIQLLENNSLLGEYVNDITETDYYKKTLKGNQEQAIINKYQKCITDSILAKYDLDSVRDLYAEKLAEQKKWTDAEFAKALEEASATSPILYAPSGTYGYVYNLLLGASEEQTEEINKIKEDNPNITEEEFSEARKAILDKIVIKDLRSTWIQSGYDFDGSKFTGDYALAGENSLDFKGVVEHLNAADSEKEDYKAQYGVKSVTEYNVAEFVAMMEEYVYGSTYSASNKVDLGDKAVYSAYNANTAADGYEERINELLFAFSTDPGSLNTYKGYLISPKPDGSNSETYKEEFAVYGRKLLDGTMGDKSYVMVATDYGYHVMFYSEKYYAGQTVCESLDSYFAKECKDLGDLEQYFAQMKADWIDWEETDNYLYTLYNEIVGNRINNEIAKYDNDVINAYVYGENSGVVKYEDRYADWKNN